MSTDRQPIPILLTHQIAAVANEIDLRRTVYEKWIDRGTMTREKADRRIAEMQAVKLTLEWVRRTQGEDFQAGPLPAEEPPQSSLF